MSKQLYPHSAVPSTLEQRLDHIEDQLAELRRMVFALSERQSRAERDRADASDQDVVTER